MKTQIRLFLTAVMFYTRIRVPANVDHSPDQLNRSTKYFPLIGWIIGGAAALVLYGLHFILPETLAVLLSMVTSIWLTGAFHEDGFADFCDGFGGGWTKQKILDIMKDSRVGTYGMVGLVLLLLTKFFCLRELSTGNAMIMLCVAHPLSRFIAVTIVYTHTYVRENEDSKAKPVSKGISASDLFVAAVFGLLPFSVLIIYTERWPLLFVLIPMWLARTYMVKLMQKWIGGFTGDGLGATQQLVEVVFYLGIVSYSTIMAAYFHG